MLTNFLGMLPKSQEIQFDFSFNDGGKTARLNLPEELTFDIEGTRDGYPEKSIERIYGTTKVTSFKWVETNNNTSRRVELILKFETSYSKDTHLSCKEVDLWHRLGRPNLSNPEHFRVHLSTVKFKDQADCLRMKEALGNVGPNRPLRMTYNTQENKITKLEQPETANLLNDSSETRSKTPLGESEEKSKIGIAARIEKETPTNTGVSKPSSSPQSFGASAVK
jgi:hypothetical protein